MQQGIMIVVSGPSGVGKGTICSRLMEYYGDKAFLSVSCTTRTIGNCETDGRQYWFISRQEFEQKIAQNGLIEYADVYGNYYGTPRKPVEDAVAAGKIVILEIDVQGGLQVKKQYPQTALVFVLPPRAEDLLVRIEGRNRGEDEQSKKRRLETAMKEVNTARQKYEYLIINDMLERAVEEMKTIIQKIQENLYD